MKLHKLPAYILAMCLLVTGMSRIESGFDQTIDNFSFQQQQYWPGIWNKCNGNLQSPIQIQSFEHSSSLKFSLWFEDKHRHFTFHPSSSLKIIYPYSVIELIMPDEQRDSVYQSTGMSFKSPGQHSIQGLRGTFELNIHYRRIHGEEGNPLVILAVPIVINNITTKDLFADQLRIITTSFKESKSINFNELLAPLKITEFFIYKGSLNKPPCNEIVTWIISEAKLQIRPTTLPIIMNLINAGQANNRVLQTQSTPKVYKVQAQ